MATKKILRPPVSPVPHDAALTPAHPASQKAALDASFAFLTALMLFQNTVEGRLWGINFGRYLGFNVWDTAVFVLILLLRVPAVYEYLAGALARPRAAGMWKRALPLVAVATTACVMYLSTHLQVAYAFLGDGSYYAGEVYRLLAAPDFHPAFLKPSSWLTGECLRVLTLWLHSDNVRLPFTVFGAAGLGIVVLSLFTNLRHEKRDISMLLSVAAIFGAGTLLFLTYVELYALSYALTIAYFLASWRALRLNGSVFAPGLLLLAAAAFALPSLVFVPSYLLLLHWRFRGEHGPVPLARAALLLCVLIVAAVIGGYFLRAAGLLPDVLIPLTAGDSYGHAYTLLSLSHLLDILNSIVLIAGVFSAVLIGVTITARKRVPWRSPLVLFALVAAGGGLFFIACGDAFLGLARDWDLMTAPVFSLIFLCAVVLTQLREQGDVNLYRILPILAGAALFTLYMWIRVNVAFDASHDADARRFEKIVRMDEGIVRAVHTYTGYDILRTYAHQSGRQEQEIDALFGMLATGHLLKNTDDKLANAVMLVRDPALRRQSYTRFLDQIEERIGHTTLQPAEDESSPRELVARVLLSASQTGDAALAQNSVAHFSTVFPNWREAALVSALLESGLTPAQRAERSATAVDPTRCGDAALSLAAARVQAAGGAVDRALPLYERSLALAPGVYPPAYIEAAKLAFEVRNDRVASQRYLRDCITHAPASPEALDARRILGMMEQSAE
ncbi:MAG: hypothetical protein HY962_02560 [Ignavibacteriae bacterium]|nr:hypothetical protein [Ignavibacteriota bacterium]